MSHASPRPRGKTEVIEVALPSGCFAKIRPIMAIDIWVSLAVPPATEKALLGDDAIDPGSPVQMLLPTLISRVVTFDGQKLTPSEVCRLDARDSSELADLLMPYMRGPIKSP